MTRRTKLRDATAELQAEYKAHANTLVALYDLLRWVDQFNGDGDDIDVRIANAQDALDAGTAFGNDAGRLFGEELMRRGKL